MRFSYRAPEGCPSEYDQAARTLSIAIAHDEKWRASLQTEGIASGKASRSIDGDSCEAVAESIAIFTAIALREGSPDELPPAHPELAKKESLETPEEGFMPMARPQRPGPPVIDLYRGRFALVGAIWARPRPQNSPQYVDHPYAAAFYFKPSLGMRPFVSDDVALIFQTHLDFYERQNLDTRYDNAFFDQTGTVHNDNETFAVGGGFQIGITFFPTRARRWLP